MPTPRKTKPPKEIQAKCANGHPRCQYWKETEAGPQQCKRTARKGFPVCYLHGAGSEKREREGKAKNPATAALKHGGKAKTETLKLAVNSDPAFQALFDHHLASDSLLDFREEVALGKALVRFFVAKAKLSDTDNGFGKVPPALAAIDRLEKVIAAGERALKVEASLGAITHEELRYYWSVVAETLDVFVAAGRHTEARAYLTRRLRERDFGRLGLPAPVHGAGDSE